MGRLSRGCLRCRQRRVRCDEARPSCDRCVKRNEVCEGYRDDLSIMFRDETLKVVENAQAAASVLSPSTSQSSAQNSRRRSRSVGGADTASDRRGSSISTISMDPAALTPRESSGLKVPNSLPWLKMVPPQKQPPLEEQAVESFIERYVMYPCNYRSSPGFLEHLPSMFKEVSLSGRYALRWAVSAAAYADMFREQESEVLKNKALQCYGMALTSLGDSLGKPGKAPDDYDLMTVVVLDLFETIFLHEQGPIGSHAEGMAHVLRLRGSDQFYSPRGWSLFRLAHHRIQKQQLAFNMKPISETTEFFELLNEDEPSVQLESNILRINKTCKRARDLLELINAGGQEPSAMVAMIQEMHSLDEEAASWRDSPQWAFETLTVAEHPELETVCRDVTPVVQLHSDLWLAYEWNYHRTARMICNQQLLKCLTLVLESPGLDPALRDVIMESVGIRTSIIQTLADEILATVPQTFGDIDHTGRLHDFSNGPPRCRGIGGYLLLWSIKTLKGEDCVTTAIQRERGVRVFERIREYTGMKFQLGDKSLI